jgi:hypothetical protein
MEYVTYSRKAGAAIGQMIVTGFGTLWMISWCLQQRGVDAATLMLIALAGAAIFLAAWSQFRAGRRQPDTREEKAVYKARGRGFLWVNVAQWLALFASGPCLAWLGHSNWGEALGIMIVGVHFVPLARLFRTRQHYLTGLALILVALAYPWLGDGTVNYALGGFATGSVLWISALVTFYRLGDRGSLAPPNTDGLVI